MGGWIGTDLDGVLAEYGEWQGPGHIGKPIPKMVERVKKWLKDGVEVRIVTARVGPQKNEQDVIDAEKAINAWCMNAFGQKLPVTCSKDYAMITLWDDRVVQVITNTGMRADGQDILPQFNRDGSSVPYSLAELANLEAHLDDETEWSDIDGFWEAWGPRVSDRIDRLIITAKAGARRPGDDIFKVEEEAYQKMKPDLLRLCKGKFAVFECNQYLGCFDDERAAYAAGIAAYGFRQFMIKEVLEQDRIVTMF